MRIKHPGNTSPFMKFPSWLKSKRFWLPCLSIVILCLLVYKFNSQLWVKAVELYNILGDRQQLKGVISSFGHYSPLIFILVQFLQVIIAFIPGVAIEFVGGYLFGITAGFLYSMVGITLGSWVAFTLAKTFEKLIVEKIVSPGTLKRFDYLIGHEGVVLSLLLFLIPGFPKDALCYILGLTPMRLGVFLLISTVGRMPGVLLLTLQGAKAFNHEYQVLLILFGVSLLAVMTFYIYHDEVHGLIKKWYQ